MDLYWYVAYWATLCTQTRRCSSEMAKVPPNSSDANYAPTSSHLTAQRIKHCTSSPSTPWIPSPRPCCQLRSSSGCTGNRGRVCVPVTGLVLSHATRHLKLGMGGAAVNPQKHQQDQGVLPGPRLQEKSDKLTVLLSVHINVYPSISR